MKYNLPEHQSEVLPNLMGFTDPEDIAFVEFDGFSSAELLLATELTSRTRFNEKYIQRIHKMALGNVYEFAGKYREVNMSKSGFPFAAARFLSQSMQVFEQEILSLLPHKYKDAEKFIQDLAIVHGELLFIHPFREGNGRTARLLANLMCLKQGYEFLNYKRVDNAGYDQYVKAVQQAGQKNYQPMINFITSIFVR
jgi:cell filamentation protein